jgi:hypothetical protein
VSASEKLWTYKLVQVHEATRLAEIGWEPVPHVLPVHDQSRGFVGSTTYVWVRKEVEVR